MKHYKDCQLKGRILHCIVNNITTSRGIYEKIGHPSYPAFRSELYSLKRRGYITTLTSKKPHTYSLTKLGRLHAQDPYIQKRRKQEYINSRVDAILNDNERFQAAVENEVKNRFPVIPSPSGNFSPSQKVNPHPETAHLMAELKSKDEKIIKLNNRIRELMQPKISTCQPRLPASKTPQEQKQEQERVIRRQKLAQMYASHRHPLDFDFFQRWGDMHPYRMKHLQLFKAGSVEILGSSNPEHGRGHARRPLSPQEIVMAQFVIKDMRKDGIIVHGKGMSSDRLLRW